MHDETRVFSEDIPRAGSTIYFCSWFLQVVLYFRIMSLVSSQPSLDSSRIVVGTNLFLLEIAGSLEPSERFFWHLNPAYAARSVHVISCLGGVCMAGRGVAIQKPPHRRPCRLFLLLNDDGRWRI